MNENTPDDKENIDDMKMRLYARIAQSAYVRNKKDKDKLVNEFKPDMRLLEQYTDKHHTTFEDESGNIYLGVRGTDISNSFKNRTEDLITDLALTLGLEGLTPRYKRSEKMIKKIMEENKNKKISLAGHSMAGLITKQLGLKNGLETHAFAPAFTHIHLKSNILKYHPETKKKIDRIHSYITTGADPISTSVIGDMLSKVHIVPMKKLKKNQKGVLASHSIFNFF